MARRKTLEPKFEIGVPEGDDRERPICAHCGFVDYRNPKVVVGSVAVWKAQILLCQRAIEPRKGFWTLPAGYLELGESVEDGALREAYEEARARLALDRVLAVYSVQRISQVQIMFRARLLSDAIEPGPESEDVRLFDWKDIPWPDIAFPTVGWALRQYWESRSQTDFAPYSNPVEGI